MTACRPPLNGTRKGVYMAIGCFSEGDRSRVVQLYYGGCRAGGRGPFFVRFVLYFGVVAIE